MMFRLSSISAAAPAANGEGWHNNHHADPRSARHGDRWSEIDETYVTIRPLFRDSRASLALIPVGSAFATPPCGGGL
jgi:hypothetical protein